MKKVTKSVKVLETMSHEQMVKGTGMFSVEKRRLKWYRVGLESGYLGAFCSLQILERFSFG